MWARGSPIDPDRRVTLSKYGVTSRCGIASAATPTKSDRTPGCNEPVGDIHATVVRSDRPARDTDECGCA